MPSETVTALAAGYLAFPIIYFKAYQGGQVKFLSLRHLCQIRTVMCSRERAAGFTSPSGELCTPQRGQQLLEATAGLGQAKTCMTGRVGLRSGTGLQSAVCTLW